MTIIAIVETDAPTDNPLSSVLASTEPATAGPKSISGRDMALFIIAAIALVFALQWAQSFFVSLVLGILFAYTLNRLVVWLELIRIPRSAGTSLVMIGVVCAIALGANSVSGQIQTILDQVPDAVSKLSVGVAKLRQGEASTMQKMQTAATQIEKATTEAVGLTSPPTPRVTRVVMDSPGFKLGNFLWATTAGAAALAGQAGMVLSLTFFLLLSGDTYKRKLVRLAGPSLSKRKITLHILEDINESIQRYMFMLLVTNLLVGLVTWIALSLIGLENAGAWAVAAGLLHLIPYLGPVVTAVFIGMAAFVQFDTLSMMLSAAGVSLLIATFIGHFVTTWMTGRIGRMNMAAVFVSLLFWTWLWGIWGMLLSAPIIVIVKVAAQRVENFAPVAELLGD